MLKPTTLLGKPCGLGVNVSMKILAIMVSFSWYENSSYDDTSYYGFQNYTCIHLGTLK